MKNFVKIRPPALEELLDPDSETVSVIFLAVLDSQFVFEALRNRCLSFRGTFLTRP